MIIVHDTNAGECCSPRNCTNLSILWIELLRRWRGGKMSKLMVALVSHNPHVTPTIHYSENFILKIYSENFILKILFLKLILNILQ